MRRLNDEEREKVAANLGIARSYAGKPRRGLADHDDVAQESALGLMHAVTGFDPAAGELTTYAKRWCLYYIQEHRRRGRLVPVPRRALYRWADRPDHVPVTPLRQADPTVPIEELLSIQPEEIREDADLPASWLEGLNPVQRAVLRLKFVEQLTAGEIAASLGVSRRRVNAILEKCRERLRVKLAEHDPRRPSERGE